MTTLALVALTFEALPRQISVGIVPTAAALGGLVATTVTYLGRANEIPQTFIHGVLVGGWFGAGFFILGLLRAI